MDTMNWTKRNDMIVCKWEDGWEMAVGMYSSCNDCSSYIHSQSVILPCLSQSYCNPPCIRSMHEQPYISSHFSVLSSCLAVPASNQAFIYPLSRHSTGLLIPSFSSLVIWSARSPSTVMRTPCFDCINAYTPRQGRPRHYWMTLLSQGDSRQTTSSPLAIYDMHAALNTGSHGHPLLFQVFPFSFYFPLLSDRLLFNGILLTQQQPSGWESFRVCNARSRNKSPGRFDASAKISEQELGPRVLDHPQFTSFLHAWGIIIIISADHSFIKLYGSKWRFEARNFEFYFFVCYCTRSALVSTPKK